MCSPSRVEANSITRGKKLDYIRTELSHLNEYWEKDTDGST